ncbi:MAG: 30S ribosomal protein S17 [uncultured bacterium]|nr:MAG: 30S ribosomal protein S17 [uncultured bacterium]
MSTNTTKQSNNKTSHQKIWSGIVASDINDKTVVVSVSSSKIHSIYKKRFVTTKKYHVHDQSNKYKINDIVKFVETKPISKNKHYIIFEK